jgi:hypothetical protein
MNLIKQHLSNLPTNLVDILQKEFQKLHTEYAVEHWEPSQLDGGRFAETVLRIIEKKDVGQFTAIDQQLNRLSIVRSAERNTNLADSIRFQIPRLASLILDFRNNRNVGHLGKIDVNGMDSNFVLQASNWILAELIRLETQMSPKEAQLEIKKIIDQKIPVIEEIDNYLKCLNSKLKIKKKILLLCYKKYPNRISLKDLFSWSEYGNITIFRKNLIDLNKDALIDFKNNTIFLTRKGVVFVEKEIKFEID